MHPVSQIIMLPPPWVPADFYFKNYAMAYQLANELISANKYTLSSNVTGPFSPAGNSSENIFVFEYNAGDGPVDNVSPTRNLYNAYQANQAKGFLSLNKEGILSQLMFKNIKDARKAFYTVQPNITYINGKYSTTRMDLPYIRLAEMYLTRAESDIMVNNAVSQQDVQDINILRNRADATTVLTTIPSKDAALDTIFNDRTKELAIELSDHFLNVKRLQKGIIKTPEEGGGIKSYSEYVNLLVFPFPQNEIEIHGLTRNQ